MSAGARALADDYLPVFDAVMRHERVVAAPAAAVWEALHRANFAGAWYVRALLTLRGLRRPADARQLTLARLIASGFIPLGERPGREIALGLVGRFWRPSGGRVRLSADEFAAFTRPGYARAVWTFSVDAIGAASTRLATETRVACTDPTSRRRFRIYWALVRPFSGLIRRAMLDAVARAAQPRDSRQPHTRQ